MTTMDALLNAILVPWQWDASLEMYWPILVEGALVAVALGLIGCWLVVRGTSLLGDALAHSVLPGIVLGFMVGVWTTGQGSLHSPWILIGATAMGIVAALLVQAVHEQSRVKVDASLGIVFTTLFALGVVMINWYVGQADLDPECVLYGNIVMFVLEPEAIWPMAALLAGIVLLMLLFYRQLLVSTFDPLLAISLGIPAVLVHYGLMALLSLTIVTSFEAVGAILSVALLIMPGATARLWTSRMPAMLLLAAAHGLASTALGYWLSHPAVLDTSAAGAISVSGFGLFLLSWLVAPGSGLLMRLRQRRRLSRMIAVENLLKTTEELAARTGREMVPTQRLAGELHVPRRAFAATLKRALSRNWVEQRDGQVALTPVGRQQSRRIERAHVLWERYLRQELHLPADHVHDAAEWVEHHLSDPELGELEAMLGSSSAAEENHESANDTKKTDAGWATP